MKQKRIIAVHLLNDFSGSPFVLRQSLEALVRDRYAVELYTATPSGSGFLTDIAGVRMQPLFYKWSSSKLITLLFFLYSQASLFFRLLVHVKRTDIVYVNSLLPFGAALAGRMRGARVLYHIHEVSVRPALLRWFLIRVAGMTATRSVFVSQDVLRHTGFTRNTSVIYNALPETFIRKALEMNHTNNERFTVLMLCSLKKYKGVFQFLTCARQLPDYRFELVLNASAEEIRQFFAAETIPSNLELFPAQRDVHPFYRRADVVMNLSLPDQWIETFGMTVLEAMYYQLPVIVPYTGGITELVTDEKEGYLADPYDTETVCARLRLMATCPDHYRRLSINAANRAGQFTPAKFAASVRTVIAQIQPGEQEKKSPAALQLPLF